MTSPTVPASGPSTDVGAPVDGGHPRGRGGRLATLAGGGVLAVTIAAFLGVNIVDSTSGHQVRRTHQVLPATIDRVVVHTSSGEIHLRGADAGTRVVLDTRASGTIRTPHPVVRIDRGTLDVTSDCHEFWRCSLTLDVAVPRGVSVTADSSSGDITTTDLTGAVRLRTSSGDVEASRPGGDLDARSGSGDVLVSAARTRRLSASTSSGNVRVDQATEPDDLVATTFSGDVRVTVPPGDDAYDVRVDTSSGSRDVLVRTDPAAARHLTAAAASGDISVTYRNQ